ncbi:MAG: acetylglutamate kinase [Deltaproteobacteria bacterium]|nr:acetylglutamate kinase [Deltaproteobacteria bacterium]
MEKTIVIKYGGHAMTDENLKENFARNIIALFKKKIKPVIVHGGGPQINNLLMRLGIVSEFINGLRVTDKAAMEVVEMTLCGSVNKAIVAQINKFKPIAVGISGKDANCISAKQLADKIKLGLVGEVKKVNPSIINILINNNFIPVIAPVGIGEDNKTYNINADIAASGIAAALCADSLILITDVDGILDKAGELLSRVNVEKIKQMIDQKIITAGMIPKIKCAVSALNKGVKKVSIVNGKKPNIISDTLMFGNNIGTEVTL